MRLCESDASVEFKRHGWYIDSLTAKINVLGTNCWDDRVLLCCLRTVIRFLMMMLRVLVMLIGNYILPLSGVVGP
jgi:hypothetical protein